MKPKPHRSDDTKPLFSCVSPHWHDVLHQQRGDTHSYTTLLLLMQAMPWGEVVVAVESESKT